MATDLDREHYPLPTLTRPSSPRWMRRAIVALTVAVALLGLIGSGQIFDRASLGMSPRGTVVQKVTPGGPAALAGLRSDDRIISIDGVPAERPIEGALRLRQLRAGESLSLSIERDGAPPFEMVLVGGPPTTSELIYRFTMGTAGLFALGLGFFIAYRRPEKLTFVFFGICFSMAFILREHPIIHLSVWSHVHEALYTASQIALPAFLVHFFLLFPRRTGRRARFERVNYVAPAIVFLAWLVNSLPLARMPDAFEQLYDIAAPAYFAFYLGFAITLFVRSVRSARDQALKARLRVCVWGTVLGVMPLAIMVIINILFPAANLPGTRWAVPALVLVPTAFAYAAFRHRIFDIEYLVKRSLVYSSLTALLLAIYFGMVAGMGAILHRLTGASNPLLVLVSIVAMALIAAPLRQRLQRFVDRVFYRDRYDARVALRSFSHDLARMVSVGSISTLLVQRVSELLDVETVSLVLRSDVNAHFALAQSTVSGPRPDLSSDVTGVIGDHRRPLRLDEPEDAIILEQLTLDDRRALASFQTQILVPLHAHQNLVGLLLLGPRRGLGWASTEDLELLETLGEQTAIALQNATLHEEAVEKERVARDLELAQGIQAHLVPAHDPLTALVEFAGSTVACHEIGGDFYDYVPLDDQRIGIAIGDVSGKGIPAALLMAGLQSSFRTEAERGLAPSDVLQALNHRILTVGGELSRFVCFFYGILDLDRRQMVYANAGLDPPILVRSNGRVERLRSGGPILGVLETPTFREGMISLSHGDALVLYTDGLVEPIENRTGRGDADLVRFVVDNRTSSASELRKRIIDRLHDIAGEVHDDDTTLIVARAV